MYPDAPESECSDIISASVSPLGAEAIQVDLEAPDAACDVHQVVELWPRGLGVQCQELVIVRQHVRLQDAEVLDNLIALAEHRDNTVYHSEAPNFGKQETFRHEHRFAQQHHALQDLDGFAAERSYVA